MSRGLPRILVLTGTSAHPFPRLLDALPGLVRGGVAEEVRVQSPVGAPSAPGIVALGALSRDALALEIERADVVISHAGSGSCFEAIRAGHRPIVVTRRAALGEHVDDHQADLAGALAARGLAFLVDGDTAAAVEHRLLGAVVETRPPDRGHPRPPPSSSVAARLRSLVPRRALRSRGVGSIRVHPAEEADYAAFYRSCPFPHPLQSTAWGEARRVDGWKPRWWLARGEDGRAIAGAQVLSRGVPRLGAYLPFGPVVADASDGPRAARAILRRISRGSAAGLLWAPYPTPEAGGAIGDAGSVPVDAPSRTGFVPLGSDDEMLARMRGTWRAELRRGLALASVTVRWEDPKTFVPLLLDRVRDLARAKGFTPPIEAAVGAAFAERAEEAGVELLCVTVAVEGRPTHAYVAAIAGRRAQTLWAAQTAEESAGVGTGRVALWSLLRAARDRGCLVYDLAGIDDAGNAGVASFKRGLRPDVRDVPGLRWLPPAWAPANFAEALMSATRPLLGRARPGRLPAPSPE